MHITRERSPLSQCSRHDSVGSIPRNKIDLSVSSKMSTHKCSMGWQTALMCTFALWLAMVTSASGQCFADDDKPCSASSSTIASGSIDFAISLFKSVAQPPSLPGSGNCHISPVSVRTALTTTYLGSRNNTKVQLQTALWLGSNSQKQVLQKYHTYKSALEHNATEAANYTIKIADKIYLDKSLTLRPCMVSHLKSELQQADFRSAPDASRQLINQWVENQTNNRIVDLLPDGSIDSSTRMVIVNAIFLQAAWNNPFKPSKTSDGDFFVVPGTSKTVSMMHQTGSFSYASSPQLGCTAVELPYSGNEISMVFLLPNTNAQDLVGKLNAKDLRNLLSSLSQTLVGLTVPKYTLTQTFKLTEDLKSLNITDLFDKDKADLSGFTGAKNIFATAVYHKTFIQVDEEGTEAAAATGVVVGTTAIIVPKVVFTLNKPFLFFIRKIADNSVLFMGLINDPTLQS